MNSKERVLMALKHEEPDKVPIDIMLAPEVSNTLAKLLNIDTRKDKFALAKALGHDILYINIGICDGFSSIYSKERKIEENLYQDVWGIKWRKKTHRYGSYCEFAEHPLADIKKYDSYRWPDPMIDGKWGLELYRDLIEKDGKKYAIMGGLACTVLEASWYLRGLERFLEDILINRDFAEELLDKTMNYHLALGKELVKMGVDIIWLGDDISMERGPLMNPKLYRKLIKSRHAYIIEELRKINKDIIIAFHSDGNIEWALDDLVEIGINVLNPLQPDVNNVEAIKNKYGKKLTFWGNVDTRHVMNTGSPKEVIEEVKNVIDKLSTGGGHILCSNHRVQSSARALDNTITYYWAANKFRDYPIK